MVGLYYSAINDWEKVSQICKLLESTAPQHEVTRILKTRLDQARSLPEFSQTLNIVQTIVTKGS